MAKGNRFTQADVARALRAARASGYPRVRLGIDVNGNIVIDVSQEAMLFPEERPNPLDRLLLGR